VSDVLPDGGKPNCERCHQPTIAVALFKEPLTLERFAGNPINETAGGRLLLAMLEKMVTDAGGSYLMCDTDSMAIVASERGGLVPCNGGRHLTTDGNDAIRTLSWEEVRRIVGKFAKLNPYNPKIVPGSILNIVEEMNFDRDGRQRQLYGYGISAKRYSLYVQDRETIRLIKVSEHGLGL
jgi:hypothetical protein